MSTMQIIGDADFRRRTELAFDALRSRAPDAYTLVRENIDLVESVPHGSGMYADETPSRFIVGQATSRADTIWYAGVLVHDATHSALYRQYRALHDGDVPREAWVGAEAERQCLRAQRLTLVQLGAPDSLLRHLDRMSADDYYSASHSERWW